MSVGMEPLLIVSKAVLGCLLITTVVTMAVIDSREMILPNRLNAVLAAGGIVQAVFIGRPDFTDALLGALFGFCALSFIATLFRRARGFDGLGFGDQKFAGAAGLWIGWELISPMLLIASCSALAFSLIRFARSQKFDSATRLPFGPFLGLGTVACWSMTIVAGS